MPQPASGCAEHSEPSSADPSRLAVTWSRCGEGGGTGSRGGRGGCSSDSGGVAAVAGVRRFVRSAIAWR
eukprot:1380572-Rhodomonas_salina.1